MVSPNEGGADGEKGPQHEMDGRLQPKKNEATRSCTHTNPKTRTRHRRSDSSPPTPSFPSKRRARSGGSLEEPMITTDNTTKNKKDTSMASTRTVHIVETFLDEVDVVKRNPKSTNSAPLPREVDFYRSPTVLGRCIVNQKYGNAVKRALQHPEETKIWMCSKRNNQYNIRQLPIHIACGNLITTYDDRQLTILNELIALLVMSYPEGANAPDHRGRLPLSEALWYGADAPTLAVFFVAHPDALSVRDKRGRSLSDLNRNRSGLNKVQVQNLLDKGVSFWRKAREEVQLRQQIDHVIVPAGSLAASQSGDDSLVKAGEVANVVPETLDDEVQALSWDQLEKRLIAAEKILDEVNERNYELSQRGEASNALEHLLAKELLQELQKMHSVNAKLARKVRSLESMLERHVLKGDKEMEGQLRLALAEVSSLAALSDKTSLASHASSLGGFRKVTKQTQELTRRQEEQRERIRKIKFIIDSLSEGGYESSVTAHSELSSKSNYSNDFRHAPGLIVDRTPATRLKASNLELEAIFKYGAAYDFARRFPGLGEANADDLDLILKWAASQESVVSMNDEDFASAYSPAKPLQTPRLVKVGKLYQREIKLPALLPYDDTGIDPSYFEEHVPGGQSLEEVDPILLSDEYTGVLSETQASI